MTTYDYFGGEIARRAAEHPTAPAIFGPDRTLDFATVLRAIEGTAGALHEAGAARGSVAAIVLRNRPRDLIAALALLRIGAPMLTLDPDEPAEMRRVLVERAGARLIVGEAEDAVAGLPVLTPTRAWQDHPPIALPPPPPDTLSYLTRSSGTTGGISKLAPTRHANEIARHRSTFSRFPLGADDRLFTMLRFSFAISRDFAIRGLSRGGAVVIPPPLRSAEVLLRSARAQGATWMVVTPMHLRDLLRWRSETPLLPGVKILSTSAALAPAERQQVMRAISPLLYINYGTTEVGGLAMAIPEEVALGPSIVGRVEPDIEAQAVDDADRPLPPGTIGVLRFRHPRFATAYLNADPAATSRFADGWFYPGDVGLIDAERRIHLKGRVDDVINVSGRKVHPADIEAALHAHPSVRDAVALGLPSRRLGQVPVAVAVVADGTDEETLRAHCRERLGAPHAPRRIALVEAIPRTDGGKVDRRTLADLVRRTIEAADERE